jgi:hypothetical protein
MIQELTPKAFLLVLVSLMPGLNLDCLRGNNLNERHGTVSGTDGVVFETATDENAWAIPEEAPGAITKVRFGLKITNGSSNPVRINGYRTYYPEWTSMEERAYVPRGGANRSRLIRETDCPLIEVNRSLTLFIDAVLEWKDEHLDLRYEEPWGGLWFVRDLKPGTYELRFHYQNSAEVIEIPFPDRIRLQPFWTGQIVTRPVKIELIRKQN